MEVRWDEMDAEEERDFAARRARAGRICGIAYVRYVRYEGPRGRCEVRRRRCLELD